MPELIKITDITGSYGVSARTLRYYENIGLLASTRSDDYAYRLYDEAAVQRLEQILILRKLNISIKDIQRIFNTPSSEVVLEVLGKKVGDIDDEVALLHELKEIVLEFIRQLKAADFSSGSDIKLLYEKARDIETQLANVDYSGNPANVNRLLEVAEKLEEKAISRMSIPENVMKRLLQNVYFIWGDGADIANELGRRYGIYVYHTCENRGKHTQNADPKFQPGMFRPEMDFANYFAQDPEDAMRGERAIVRDYTPMVLMDLIQLTATHEKVICENAIDVDSIIPFVTHAVKIINDKGIDDFYDMYESEIRRRDVSDDEREWLIGRVNMMREKIKREASQEAEQYSIKQFFRDEDSTVEQTADLIEEYFGLSPFISST